MLEKIKEIELPQGQVISVDRGIVIVGANGSGKTRLGVWIENNFPNKDLVYRISAQKSLLFPSNIRPMAMEKATNTLRFGSEDFGLQHRDRHRYGGKPATALLDDYQKLLVFLFSDENKVSSEYRKQSKDTEDKVPVPATKLDKIKEIWEEILSHRLLLIESGNVKAKANNAEALGYDASEMSDDERIIFYLIGQCLAAPESGLIIIDEPEMHLHKAIQYMLWDKIQRERPDCVFIYITHDVSFAASRSDFVKIWLKSYDGKKDWQLEILTESVDLPEELLLELYGSRRKILLIEGSVGSNESRFYQNIFEYFLVKPCGSCDNVISYVKALKNNSVFHRENVYGLIDRDRRTDEEIEALKEQGIFTLEVAEFENLFVTPGILEIISKRQGFHETHKKISKIQAFVFERFDEEFETQVQYHVQENIKWLLCKLDISKPKDRSLNDLISEAVNCDVIHKEITEQFKGISERKDYVALLKKFNRKTIASQVGESFGLGKGELPNLVMRLSGNGDFRETLKDAVLPYLPTEFVDILND